VPHRLPRAHSQSEAHHVAASQVLLSSPTLFTSDAPPSRLIALSHPALALDNQSINQ
jgi:hypothetical protein